MLHSLCLCLSMKLFVSLWNLNETLVGWGHLACRLLPFISLNASCKSLLAYSFCRKISWWTYGDRFVCGCFSLAAFNIFFSLNFIFVSSINVCLSVFFFGFMLCGPLSTSWTSVAISSLMLGKLSTIISSSMFSDPFSRPSGTPAHENVSTCDAAWGLLSCPHFCFQKFIDWLVFDCTGSLLLRAAFSHFPGSVVAPRTL